jgi:hypothetical protein
MRILRLLSRAWERGSEKGVVVNLEDTPATIFDLQHPTHARYDDAFSEGSEVQFFLIVFREHICGIEDTRIVFQVNFLVLDSF